MAALRPLSGARAPPLSFQLHGRGRAEHAGPRHIVLQSQGATVKDGAGNVADLSGATDNNPAGTLQIDTILPSVSSIATSGTEITNGSGNLGTARGSR